MSRACVWWNVSRRTAWRLNLTWEVRDGILNHQTSLTPATLEGKIVRLSDKIAYINSDIDDFDPRRRWFRKRRFPYWLTDVLGHSTNHRLNTLVHDIVRNSEGKDDICMSPEVEKAMFSLRSYMYRECLYQPRCQKRREKGRNVDRAAL